MKLVYKCDYCGLIATRKEIKVHEPACVRNYKRKSCYTCQYSKMIGTDKFKCTCGEDTPANGAREFCKKYFRTDSPDSFAGIFTSLLGGM